MRDGFIGTNGEFTQASCPFVKIELCLQECLAALSAGLYDRARFEAQVRVVQLTAVQT